MTSRFHTLLATAGLTVASALSAPVAMANVPLSQEPLYITNRIKPAFIMAIDDSGSMNWETLFPTQDGRGTWNAVTNSFYHPTELAPNGRPRPYRSNETGNGNGLTSYLELFPFPGRGEPANTIPPLPNFGFARSHEFNPGYFNPFVTYEPWARADRTLWADASSTGALVNPRVGTSASFNLTADVQQDGNANATNNTWLFDFRVGMRIPAGTVYSRNTGNNCNFGGTQIGTTGWWTVGADTNVTTNCRAGVRYFPATFYLTSPTFPGYTATPLEIVNPVGGPPNTTLYRYEIKPENMDAAAYAATMQNFANWFSYYRNRNLAVVAAITRAFLDIDFMRVGAFRINNRVDVTMFDMGIQADRNGFYDLVTAFGASGSTPNRAAIDHLGNQFRRRGPGTLPVQLACQMNAGMLFTDGYSNLGGPTVGNLDGGLGAPFADTIADKKSDIVARHYMQNIRDDLPAGLVRVPPACATANPDPRLDCRTDPHMNFYGVTLGAIGTVYGVNAAATADPYANPPAWPGRCDNCLEAVDELWQATLTGRGRYINATNPAAISQAMNDVVNAVLDSTQPVGTPSIAGPRVDSSSATFQTSFSARNNARDWVGNVTAFRINSNGSVGVQLWDAESKLTGRTDRKLFATRVAGNAGTRQVVDFRHDNFGASEADRAAAIGVSLSSFNANFTSGLTMEDAYAYLRGVRSQEQAGVRPLGFRARSGIIGSIINSPTVFESNTSFLPYYASLATAEGTAYRTYLAAKRTNFRPTVFVGANAGFMHAFDAQDGQELFAFAPSGAVPQMGLLLNRNYQHRYFVDGKFNVTDARINGSWGTVLVGNMGRGGRSVFALNVTNPAGFNAGNVLWDLPTNDNDLGFALGRPEVFEGEDGIWYAAFGNGINSTNGNPVLYLVNLSTGNVERRITANDGNFANGLLQIGIWDSNGNGKIDTIYGGDFLGNLWRFDLGSATPASWNVGLGGNALFLATDSTGAAQPITGGVSVSTGVSGGTMVHFGTGRYLSDTDAVVGGPYQTQSFYAVWDRGGTSGITRASLQQQQILSQFGTGASAGRILSENVVDYSVRNGWFIDLRVGSANSTGERVIGDPVVRESDIVFTSSEPSSDSQCAPGLMSWAYRLGRFSGRPVLDQRQLQGGSSACASGNCGALIASTSGAPVLGASFVTPQRACRPGIDVQCPPPSDAQITASCGSDDPAAANFNPNFDACVGTAVPLSCGEQGTAGLAALGGTNRPCGRQSWRQVR